MEYGEKFKRAVVGGFDRQDVLRCLQELNHQHEKSLADLRTELESYKTANIAIKESRDQMREQVSTLEEELENVVEQATQMKTQAESLQKELSSQRALNSELLMKKNVLEENCRQLNTRVAELEKKTDERVSFEVGEMMIEAKITADAMVARANERANQIHQLITGQVEGAEMRLMELQRKLGETVDGFKKISVGFVRSIEEVHRELEGCKATITEVMQEDNSQTEAEENA